MRGYYPGEWGPREQPVASPQVEERPAERQGPPTPRSAPAPKPSRRRGGRIDWVVGIALGIVLGIAVVAAFVFFGAEDTIDAPSVSGEAARPAKEAVPLTPSRR